jgi:hypothetical protein
METSKIYQYIATVSIILLVGYFGNQIKSAFTDKNDENELIRKYLLNDSPLYGYVRPKLWIHSKYEINARRWKSFQSRNTTDLNQPYIHLTVKTIMDHCGDDFNVCLIDDESFSKLIPGWDIDISKTAEPMKSHYRELGMIELLYIYGGMTIPNSFVCLRNLKSLYDMGIQGEKPFVAEGINRYMNLVTNGNRRVFTPTTEIMGAKKHSEGMRKMADYLKNRNQDPHFSSEQEFLGNTSEWCLREIQSGSINLIGGEFVGIKGTKGTPILLEDLMEEKFLDICPKRNYGILIPREDILSRVKYQWFAYMSSTELLKTNLIIVKYLLNALHSAEQQSDSEDEDEGKSVGNGSVIMI